jgi:hypothetical protein
MIERRTFKDVAPETAAELDKLEYSVDRFHDHDRKFIDIRREKSKVSVSNPELAREIGESFIEDGFVVVAVSQRAADESVIRLWFEELTVETVEKTVTEETITIDN